MWQALSVPDGFPFLIETDGGITRSRGVEDIVIPFDGSLFPIMCGSVIYERGLFIKFRMHYMLGDEVLFDMISIRYF